MTVNVYDSRINRYVMIHHRFGIRILYIYTLGHIMDDLAQEPMKGVTSYDMLWGDASGPRSTDP